MLTYVFEDDDILLQYDIRNCDRQKYTSGNFFMIFYFYLIGIFNTISILYYATESEAKKNYSTTKIKFPFPHPAELKFKFELVLTQCISRYD